MVADENGGTVPGASVPGIPDAPASRLTTDVLQPSELHPGTPMHTGTLNANRSVIAEPAPTSSAASRSLNADAPATRDAAQLSLWRKYWPWVLLVVVCVVAYVIYTKTRKH